MPKLHNTATTAHRVNLMVYGESGIGKTTLIKTAPAPLIISSERRLLALKDETIPVYFIRNRADLEEVLQIVNNSSQAKDWETICVDSSTDIAETLLLTKLEELKAASRSGQIDPRQAYGSMAGDIQAMLKSLIQVDKHCYTIARLKRTEDEGSGAVAYGPSFPGKVLLGSVAYEFDDVYAMRQGGSKAKGEYRYLQTTAGRGWQCKASTSNVLPQEKPDLGYLFQKLLQKET